MKLSTRSRYGLRAMIAITRRCGALTRSEDIAREEGVSKKYLDSILGNLRKAKLLRTLRGSLGGYALRRPPEQISAADVVEALEGKIALVPCVVDSSSCERALRCPTRDIWLAVSATVRDVLDKSNLAQLAGSVPRGKSTKAKVSSSLPTNKEKRNA